jgi:hypothetical protein
VAYGNCAVSHNHCSGVAITLHSVQGLEKLKEQRMTEDEDKPTPVDGQLVWVVVAFITLMLGLLTLRSCL